MDEVPLRIRGKDGGVEIAIHVQPRAGRNAVAGIHNGALKIKVTAPPVDNAANEAVIGLVSSLLKIPRSRLAITAGAKSRDKILRVDGVSVEEVLQSIK
jgi:uncharacterized protein (TIGR00251 family)